ncbi:M23 family metallopeptidase [Asticcacaulis sp. EMRT-3]|uniref:M23 family metallopeptidase n=1 Tax=Asticcacaulis sp. EMRT-3 TaxID=3040349 RepID=UPI0024AF2851|nr:M23 family metallopeptidase [Asticcacaulis sp. EMRT-3]MDI7774425.1 M23 family metallopeptidase [Asticcacaulis sp. EMRT-3]
MTRKEPDTCLALRGVKLIAAGMCGLLVLALQACTTPGQMPEPKYPIYMQDKPAEATETPAQAGDDQPVPAAAPVATAPAAASQGTVSVSDLPPPPPPPPPPEEMTKNTTPPASARDTHHDTHMAAAPVRDTRAAYVYVLEAHDTLYGVSRRFGVPVKQLYEINGLSQNASLRIGEKVLLPPSAVDKGLDPHANGTGMVKLATALAEKRRPPVEKKPAPVVTPPAAKPVSEPEPVKAPASVKPVVRAPSQAAATTPAATAAKTAQPTPAEAAPGGFPSNARIAEMGHGMFVWPVRGKLLVPFGQLAPNVRNDGINIGAPIGTEVRAAADGIVVYEGDQVKELGNTVYIKHSNGWYTGYSHLDSMRVKNNETVTKGEVIGTVGQTGVIDKPQLHFEVRYTPSTDIARPVDPRLVLP